MSKITNISVEKIRSLLKITNIYVKKFGGLISSNRNKINDFEQCSLKFTSIRHENESLGKNLKMRKHGQKCLKKPENQQNGAQKTWIQVYTWRFSCLIYALSNIINIPVICTNYRPTCWYSRIKKKKKKDRPPSRKFHLHGQSNNLYLFFFCLIL